MSAGAMLDALKQISVWFRNGQTEARNQNDMIAEVTCLAESFAATPPLPRIVCLCGSTRFMEAFQEANLRETLAGHIVLSVGCNTKSDADIFGSGKECAELKVRLDELHKRKIDLADEILVLNVGGYIGQSTRGEIIYAHKEGKHVRFLEEVAA